MKNLLTLLILLYFIGLSSCTAPKAYTQRSCGINGRNGGAHTVYKTQSYYNYEAANKRAKQSTFMYIVSFSWL